MGKTLAMDSTGNLPYAAEEPEMLRVIGAREHNLRNIHVSIPRNRLVVITGVSGSGKSSLAFDTLYAEGARRYLETFSAYARQFIGGMERPDVDQITGLSPVIRIEQKTISKNPRSTVGTVTEIADFLRLAFARAADARSLHTGEPMVRFSEEEILQSILDDFKGQRISLCAPLVRGRKGHYRELFEQIMRQGYLRARVDGEVVELQAGFKVDRYKIHDIEVVIDRLEVRPEDTTRLQRSIRTALSQGKGTLGVLVQDTGEWRFFSRNLMCPTTGLAYPDPEPNLFSFNSPYGACPHCSGLGEVPEVEVARLIPDASKSVSQGGILPLVDWKDSWTQGVVEALLAEAGATVRTPLGELDEAVVSAILHGREKPVKLGDKSGVRGDSVRFDGLIAGILRAASGSQSAQLNRWAQQFLWKKVCPECEGTRLQPMSRQFFLDGMRISDLGAMSLLELRDWTAGLGERLPERPRRILREPLKEIQDRLGFLCEVGLGYLACDRSSRTLSGGEAQRIRLASQMGSRLTEVLYILDEPSIGLHPRDNNRLIDSLKGLRDAGNSVLVVEHDEDMMREADHLIDMGPGAGVHGGSIVAQGPPSAHLAGDSVTADFLLGRRTIAMPAQRRSGNGRFLELEGATGHNLKDVSIRLPLGTFIGISGVSGGGKSSLINQTLYPLLHNHFYEATKQPLPFRSWSGYQYLDKVIDIDQSPIGRTPRSNPATYTGIFDEIRSLFTRLPEAAIRGYKPGRFSFNVAGGRCETCKGGGLRTIEMNFLPDVHVTCESCGGKRYNRETLEVRYRGKSIADVLDMTVDDAVEFFAAHPKILRITRTLQDVGLGYITLGQQSTTLSGGEAQRVKLASELARVGTGSTCYILDEPTTGLHFSDIQMLIDVLQRLVDRGNTVLVIEHNIDVLKCADFLVDLGPEGGQAGGQIAATGTPETVALAPNSRTAPFIARALAQSPPVAPPNPNAPPKSAASEAPSAAPNKPGRRKKRTTLS